MIAGSRLSPFGRREAIPASIHARLRLSPSKCASFGSLGSLGSGETTGRSQLPFGADESCVSCVERIEGPFDITSK